MDFNGRKREIKVRANVIAICSFGYYRFVDIYGQRYADHISPMEELSSHWFRYAIDITSSNYKGFGMTCTTSSSLLCKMAKMCAYIECGQKRLSRAHAHTHTHTRYTHTLEWKATGYEIIENDTSWCLNSSFGPHFIYFNLKCQGNYCTETGKRNHQKRKRTNSIRRVCDVRTIRMNNTWNQLIVIQGEKNIFTSDR